MSDDEITTDEISVLLDLLIQDRGGEAPLDAIASWLADHTDTPKNTYLIICAVAVGIGHIVREEITGPADLIVAKLVSTDGSSLDREDTVAQQIASAGINDDIHMITALAKTCVDNGFMHAGRVLVALSALFRQVMATAVTIRGGR